MSLKQLALLVLASLGAATAAFAGAASPGVTFTVSPAGNDRWSGRLAAPNRGRSDGPFATPERARDEIRKIRASGSLPKGGIVVEIRRGIYELSRPFELAAQDSGTAEAPIVYRARQGEEVRWIGGKVLSGWQPVTDPAVLNRLDPSVRGKVLQTDVRAQGVTDYGAMESSSTWAQSSPGLELLFGDEPMTLARWPNEGFARIADVVVKDYELWGMHGSKVGKFLYEGDRPSRWAGEPAVMLHGYWWWDWADQRYRVESIDTETRAITLAGGQHQFGFRKGQWYYAYNLLCELDQPGEWYLDRQKGILYFLPPSPIGRGKAMVSVLPTLVALKDVSYVSLERLVLEGARETAVTLAGGTHARLGGCVIRNAGAWGAEVAGGTGNGLTGCDLYNLGDGGVTLNGGDRKTLTAAGNSVDNCHIYRCARWDPMYKPGVSIDGVGNRVSHCLIHDLPHAAITFGGNDNVIEWNEIHSVVYHSNDAGVIYAYHDWTKRGQVIRNNYIHHVYGYEGRGCNGVYLDNFISGTTVSGNVFYEMPQAVFVHGGRDNTIEGNLFVNCNPAIGITTTGFWPAEKGQLLDALGRIPYKEAPWSTRYPALVNILEDGPGTPKGNVVARNVCQGGKWLSLEARAAKLTVVRDNVTGDDLRLRDPARGDFRLLPDSPARKAGLPEFLVAKMGLTQDDLRASWPVKHSPRPAPPRPAAQSQRHPMPPFRVPLVAQPIAVDGILAPGEWPEAVLTLKETPARETVTGAPATARVCHDGTTLYVALSVPVSGAEKVKRETGWGGNDGAEVCFRDASGAKPGPTFVLHGFAAGTLESVEDAGAPAESVAKLGKAARYTARVGEKAWTAEWAIPLAAAGIAVKPGMKLGFNLGALRTEGSEWIIWAGALGQTWKLDNAGTLILE